MSNRWTEAQLKAIYQSGSNILVSAGAGSGKTAVLTERVIQILKTGVPINHLLILTFTKLAANEMKQRIRKAIKKDPTLYAQEELLDSAMITTFDAYSLSLVNKYHYLLGLSKPIEIADDALLQIMKQELLEKAFTSFYEQKDEDFLHLISTFCIKDDQVIFERILAIYQTLQIRHDLNQYLEHYFDDRFSDQQLEHDIAEYVQVLQDKVKAIESTFVQSSSSFEGETYEKMASALTPLFEAIGYDEMKSVIDVLTLPRMGKDDDEEARSKKEQISQLIKELKSDFPYESEAQIKEIILSTKPFAAAIIKVLSSFHQAYQEQKREKQLFDFTDIALLAISLLANYEDIQEQIKQGYHEILLDEYQDTSDLQEQFIAYIANNNVYMVGDVKQSIYRFRNANPSLFMEKYQAYTKGEGGMKIDLNKNFRSRKEVIEDINSIFSLLMDYDFGGADYLKEHQMEFGNVNYQAHQNQANYHYQFLHYQSDPEKTYQDGEMEAFLVAKDIQKRMSSNQSIYDFKLEKDRPIAYSDFTILIDRSTQFPLFLKIFTYLHLPLEVYRNDNITESIYVSTIKNLLILLMKYQKHQASLKDVSFKHAFFSVARSFLFELSDDAILMIFEQHQLFSNIIFNTLKPLIERYESLTIPEVLMELYQLVDMEEKLIKIGDITYHSSIMEYLCKMGESLAKQGMHIDEFIKYMEQIYDKDLSIIAAVNKQNVNSVKIMTIHASKGLEFAFCYFPLLHSRMNEFELKERFSYHPKYGIIVPYFQEGIGSTIYKELMKQEEHHQEISERIRLFYVALTRVKEQMIFIINDDKVKEYALNPLLPHEKSKLHSFLDMVTSFYQQIPNKQERVIDVNDLELSKEYHSISEFNIDQVIPTSQHTLMYQPLHLTYQTIKTRSFSKKTHQLFQKAEIQKMELGNRLHAILETIDFRHPCLDKLDVEPYYKQKIAAFLALNLLQDTESATFYQEYEFMMQVDGEILHGIIDLMIEKEQEILIIDYKLKNIQDAEYEKQLAGYASYIQSISSKPVRTYLYSLLDETLQPIALI